MATSQASAIWGQKSALIFKTLSQLLPRIRPQHSLSLHGIFEILQLLYTKFIVMNTFVFGRLLSNVAYEPLPICAEAKFLVPDWGIYPTTKYTQSGIDVHSIMMEN
jgi:hypothetical protein